MADQKFADLTIDRAVKLDSEQSDEERDLLQSLSRRIQNVRQEQEFFRRMCERFDALYYADQFTEGGADLWSTDKSATTAGRSHVSINSPTVYVDVPAALQAVEPIENMLATDTTEEARKSASALERVYNAWKIEEDYDLKFHKATTVKALYGRTAGRIVWDQDEDDETGHPELQIIEQPRNLWMGYKNDSYEELEWAAYVLRYEPNALTEEYGVEVAATKMPDGTFVPVVGLPTALQSESIGSVPPRAWLNFGDARIEVWDYWYRKPVWVGTKFDHMETWNVVFAGNRAIQGPTAYPEYKGDLPYVPLFNTFIPGVPGGRSELHDTEQLIREKFEKVTAGSQMIANGVAGDYWQLVGPDAPTRVPASLKPKRNELVGTGPGNRIETITPFIAQFQLEQYLGRLDRELAVVSGLNDLLLGLAPAQVLSSSKAINALIANYESRLSMRRKLLYKWRKEIWELALRIWKEKDKTVADIVKNGAGVLDIIDPSLSPRDEMETSTRAANLVNAKLWSQRRAMDAVGVDDPETEQDMIREERTDATLFPEDVQVMAQLLSVLQSLGLNAPQGAQDQAQAQMSSGQADLRKALGARTPDNTTSSQLPGDQGIAPPIPGAPPAAGGAPAPGEQQPSPFASPQDTAMAQTMIQAGKPRNRIMTQQTLGRR
jgi:hypothetical protein